MIMLGEKSYGDSNGYRLNIVILLQISSCCNVKSHVCSRLQALVCAMLY